MLAEKLGFFHSISSQLGRDYIKSHFDQETLRQKENYEKGLLFDSDWMFRIVQQKTKEIFEQSQEQGGIIYDGSPRTLYEAKELCNFLTGLIGRENIKIIYIDIDENELRRRIERRLICNNSPEHVFIKSGNLKPGSPCPESDGILIERDLDKKEIFDVRMEKYKKETIPALEFLKRKHKVITINGNQPIEAVRNDITRALDL
ncbi:MAG: nucleoside monophosphate kinase [Candidatus Terrybacteria bacterium]|nr:nucleoside monophosphate kinase [Candidatus Terrybacteria bacterium]